VAGSTKNRLAGDTEVSGSSKDERRRVIRAFRKLMPQKRGENENVGSSGKMRRRHRAENTLLAIFRNAKSISGSKVEYRVYYLSGKLELVN
jgi:hypothetical protein